MQNNQPVSGAVVKLGGPSTGEQTTGPGGNFKFSDLQPANNYTLDVSAPGFKAEHYEDIVVIAGVDGNRYKLPLWPN